MKSRIALLLALFTLFLSTESTFMLHFCHNQFVAASVNKEISTCCKKKDQPGPVVTGICCELSSFDTQLNDTVLNDKSIADILPSYFAVVSETAVGQYCCKRSFAATYHQTTSQAFQARLIYILCAIFDLMSQTRLLNCLFH